MSDLSENVPIAWEWPCTLGDLSVFDALPFDVRASVERYIRSRLDTARSNGDTVLSGDPKDDEYIRGWKDGIEAMQAEISSAYVPPPSRRRPPSTSQGAA